MITLKRKVNLTVSREGQNIFTSGDLRVDFEVHKVIGDALNTARITVYNLSDMCVQTLAANNPLADVKLEVSKAHEVSPTTIFEGKLINMHNTPIFQDKVTTLWCWEKGQREMQETPKPPQVYKKMTVEAIANNIVSSIKDDEGNSIYSISFEDVKDNSNKAMVNSYIHIRSPKDSLAMLLDEQGLTFSIRGGVIHVTNQLTRIGQEDVLADEVGKSGTHVINPLLLKKPVNFSIATAEVFYELSPEIYPLNIMTFNVKDKELQSTLNYSDNVLKLAEGITNLLPRNNYQILKVTHTGSCYTDEWHTAIHGVIYANSLQG